MDHDLMLLVLYHLAEVGPSKSREIAEALNINPKYVTVLLGRCKRRGLVEREPYKLGREHGFVYTLSEKGAEWMLHKASVKKPEVTVPPEPKPKVIVKPVLIFLQKPEPSFLEKLVDSAKTHAFIKNLNKPRQQADPLTSLSFWKQRRNENDLQSWILSKDRKQDEYGKLVSELLKGNQELTKLLLQHAINEELTFSKHSKFSCSIKKLETAMEQLAMTATKISCLPRECSANKEKTNKLGLFLQPLHNRAAYYSYLDRWWDTLKQINGDPFGNIFESVLKDYSPSASTSALKNRLEPPKPKFCWSGTVPPEVLRLC